jgi:hypothetical protein
MPRRRLGYVEGVTRDYKRHGTTTLFAAWTCRTAARSMIASRCADIRRTHLLWLYVVSRGYTLYREAIRTVLADCKPRHRIDSSTFAIRCSERLYVLSREIGYSKYWEPTRLSSRDDFLVMPMETYEGGEYKCETNCR